MATQAERTDATTRRLLEAARQLFGERGYAQTATEDVVAAADVTRGALYHHFGSKEGLFAAVYDAEETRLAAAAVAAASRHREPVERIRAGCRAFLDACLSPEYQRIVLLDARAVLGHARIREVESEHTFHLLADALRRASSAPLTDAEVKARTSLLFGALCEAGLLIAASPRPKSTLRVVAAQFDRILESLVDAPPLRRSRSA